VQECLEAGMDDFISKPIDPDILLQRVGKFYDMAQRPHD